MKIKILALCTCFSVHVASAEPVKSSFFTNDFLGDGRDRWRSASYTIFLGFEGEKAGGIAHEIRARGEIISPWGAKNQPTNDDRPYVGMLGFGVFANDRFKHLEYNIGAEILFTGDQTGAADFQQNFHEATGIPGYLPEDMPHDHVDDDVTGMVSVEIARSYSLTDEVSFRPFFGAQAGYETFGRIGFDFITGGYGGAARYVRDPISGFIQPSSPDRALRMGDLSLLVGADYTYVSGSDFFPNWSVAELENARIRVRTGLQARIANASAFFGITYLSKEFTSQVESQTIGVLSFEFPFDRGR